MLSKVDSFALDPAAFALDNERIERFISRWQGREGGQERANYVLFLTELCTALDLPQPDPAGVSSEYNDYVFERAVTRVARDGSVSHPRIDLYKRGCFILEAKQSRLAGARNEVAGQLTFSDLPQSNRGKKTAEQGWDVLMFNARQQAEGYGRLLPTNHDSPPFLIVCDVGHCFEVFANFRRDGKVYDQFPDRRLFRIFLEDLRDLDVRKRLRLIWTDPLALDPARQSAVVTRWIAERLAAISKALEAQDHAAEDVAAFLMRCLFTMFAEDVGLLPIASFKMLLERCEADPSKFVPLVGQLWEAMDNGGFAFAIEANVQKFNGKFFKRRDVLPLGREEIGELRRAATYSWREVDPSIFGTLLEQALDVEERRRLGAHYTPRAYVERLVVATVIEPLRENWLAVYSTADRQKAEGRLDEARQSVVTFHDRLCAIRILDPACGTGNFLYVSLELMKRLEGEVLEALAALGGQEALSGLEGHTVDPRQFLGMEINPRAAAIAELVLWIGHLQWHLRTRGGMPNPPILQAYDNILVRDAVLEADKVLAVDSAGNSITVEGPDGTLIDTYHYFNARRPQWPAVDFIVGNPPFIGSKYMRSRLGSAYVKALWSVHGEMNEGSDYVMYWWNHAADILATKASRLRRFGFVTTNSIVQVFQRKTIQRHINAKAPISIISAIPDHPWTKSVPKAAAVRIAMTVCQAGKQEGSLYEISKETALDTDTPSIEMIETKGLINSNLTIGVDVAVALPLKANAGCCGTGVKLHGSGFIVNKSQSEFLGLGKREGLEKYIRAYSNANDLLSKSRKALVIDLFGLEADDVRRLYPEVYQHVLEHVKPERDLNNRGSYKQRWWIFGEPRRELRPALSGLSRYVVAAVVAKHHIFQFISGEVLPDVRLACFATSDAAHLGILSSRIHKVWVSANCATLEDRPTYITSRCFDPFPFPALNMPMSKEIRSIAEEIDRHRKNVIERHSWLNMTYLYNVLELLRTGTTPFDLSSYDRQIFDDGLVLILKSLHEKLDKAVSDAYGWPDNLSEAEILSRLVNLNRQRGAEESQGFVRWLRPEYQVARFGVATSQEEQTEAELVVKSKKEAKPSFPLAEIDQTIAVISALMLNSGLKDVSILASQFRQGKKVERKIAAVLAAVERTGVVFVLDHGRVSA